MSNLVKSQQEYNELKKDFKNDIDTFLKKFDDFVRYTSPSYWRTTGHHYSDIINLKDKLDDLEPLTLKDLENIVVRREVLTPEENEFYEQTKKYNL